jgi:hypothetical protein
MTRAISQDEFIASVPDVLSSVSEGPFIIRRGNTFIAALVSEQEFDMIRRAKGERAIAAMNRMSDAIEVSQLEYESTREARATRVIDAMMAFRNHMQTVASPAELEDLLAQ